MERLKDKLFNGFSFEVIGETFREEYGTKKYFFLLRIKNHNDKRKKIQMDLKYISSECGYKRANGYEPSTFGYPWAGFIPNNTFVDLQIEFRDYITSGCDGDRIEMEINEGKFASLKLLREKGEWMVMESIERSNYNKILKGKIEHLEALEEQCGLTLQNFSVQVKDENKIDVYCEVLLLPEKKTRIEFAIKLAIYDSDNNIVYTDCESRLDDEFKGFEVLHFGTITLDITVDEISKILIYPVW